MLPIQSTSQNTTDDVLQKSPPTDTVAFPFQYYYEDAWALAAQYVDWHRHPELELVYVQSGKATCCIADKIISLTPGSALLINAEVLHHFEAEETTKISLAIFPPVLLAPEESAVYRKYLLSFLSGSQMFQQFDSNIPWQADCIHQILELFAIQESTPTSELRTIARLMDFWCTLYPHLHPNADNASDAQGRNEQQRIQQMMQFIQSNYSENIQLIDIAQAAFIGKSSALRLFGQYIHTSPVAYLIQYRLKQASRLLKSTDKKISVIAKETGFQSDAYFCRKFKNCYGISPQLYRKQTLEMQDFQD